MKSTANIISKSKHILLLFLFLLIGYCTQAGSLEIFSKCITSKNMTSVQKYFSENIEVIFENQKNILDQEKASKFINNFLDRNEVVQFNIQKSSKSNSTQQNFSIGTLVTKVKTYKVFITMNTDDVITQIQFK